MDEFFKDLKKNPQNQEGIAKKVYALYYDSYDHPENIFNMGKSANSLTFIVLLVVFPVILILFAIFGS